MSPVHVLFFAFATTLYHSVGLTTASCDKPREQTIACENINLVPHNLSQDTKAIIIKNHRGNIPIAIPDNANWSHITKLDISLSEPWSSGTIMNNTFIRLPNLESFGIHGHELYTVEIRAFAGLQLLEQLDFSGCGRLSLDKLLPSLDAVPLPALSSLNLEGLHSSWANAILWDAAFWNFLIKTPILKLDMSGTNILLSDDVLVYQSIKLESINLSNITYRNIGDLEIKTIFYLLPNLKVINISHINGRHEFMYFNDKNKVFNMCRNTDHVRKLTEIYANDNANDNTENSFDNVTLDANDCSIAWKHLQLRKNNIRKLNATLTWPNNNLIELDLSDNTLVYIAPAFLGDLKHLKTLRLANNSLCNMQLHGDFQILLASCVKLEEFSLANNRLSSIPKDMFRMNKQIRVLDLAGNWLETVHFDLEMMVYLEKLILKGNNLRYFDSLTLRKLSDVLQSINGTHLTPDIDFENNPFECSCDSVDSLKWTLKHLHSSRNERMYSCRLEERTVDINTEAVKHAEYLCIRTKIIAIISITCSLTSGVLLMLTVLLCRKIRQRRQADVRLQFVNDFKTGNLKCRGRVITYLAFLSHCSEDDQLITHNVYQEMNRVLTMNLQEDRVLVCLGDKCFRPGFAIIEETMKCLSQSCVAVFVISRAFCQSSWCQMEVKEAYAQQKPILLIFTEHIEEDLMSTVLLNIYRGYTRAKIIRRSDKITLEPSWELFCDALIQLASVDAQEKLRECED